MNSADNFRGAEIGAAQKIDIYFESATSAIDTGSYDRVRLNVDAAGNEEKALEAIAGALQGNKSGLTVMADDKLGTYFSDFFTGVDSFTTASMSIKDKTESLTANKDLTTADSGTTFFLNAAAGLSSIKLPSAASAGAGWNAKFVVATVTTSNNYVITENTAADTDKIVSHMSILEIDDTDDGLHSAGHTTITFEGTPALGDFVEITCDGTRFFATGLGVSDDFVALA
tara:strand:+ start:307 stop:990 length:684 start_codon:yes stop_codon:yes gene_type:complete